MRKVVDIFILILSFYVILELLIETVMPIPENIQYILDTIDFFICMVFLSEYFFSLYLSKEKKHYIKTHWLDLISSIPFVSLFRLLRISRAVKIFRLMKTLKMLRAVKGFAPIIRYFSKNKLRSILITYSLFLVMVILYCALGFYNFENGINPNLNDFIDALWWSFMTVTSVGYGDIFPVTPEGRIFAVILTLGGMGLFSIITAEMATKFITVAKKNDNKPE